MNEMTYQPTWYNLRMPKRGEHLSAEAEPILAQAFVEGILKQAKQNLKRDGTLAPMLFLRFKEGEGGIMPLGLPDTHEERQLYFAVIGMSFLAAGKIIEEALFLSETWYVEAEKNERLTLDVAPSLHPRRREAITIVGRDAPRTRYTMVIQTFERDRHQQPVFGPPTLAEYNAFGTPTSGPVGLLDHLFSKRSRLVN